LEEKVNNFIITKEQEVELWLNQELQSWQAFLEKDETDLTEFIQTDLLRISVRAVEQEGSYRQRELLLANELDDFERDRTREQLINFRKIVRASKQAIPSNQSLFDQEPKVVEVRVLQESIAKAKSSTQKKAITSSRSLIKKQEECYDWLCSLADNALTAAIGEEKVKKLYNHLDIEKVKSMDSLIHAMAMYKEQHNQIVDAIAIFTGRIHQHATDYLQREQLINRAFMQYLSGVISGEIKSHTNDQKKNSYAWETKSLIDRQIRKEQQLIQDFQLHIAPLDNMVNVFKEKLRIQMDHVTMKLQSIVNGKENDVNARKSLIHKKLAKHVNKACNGRRQRLKHAAAARKDEFELETITMHRIDDICQDLRSGIDTLWVKEHLKERKIYEASIGRLERLEKSSLIIWNKHANMTKSQYNSQNDYQEWLETYRQDRNLKLTDFQLMLENQGQLFRKNIKEKLTALSKQIRRSFQFVVKNCFYTFDVENTLEENIETIKNILQYENQLILSIFQDMRNYLESHISSQVIMIAQFQQRMQQELLSEYQLFMQRLDHQINSQINHLKDMETDLYETIRLTILQHEVENSVFEQLSCARMEKFWIDWQKKIQELNKELLFQQEDYEISKRYSKKNNKSGGGAFSNKGDRQIDDLVTMAKESTTINNNQAHSNKASKSLLKLQSNTITSTTPNAPLQESQESKLAIDNNVPSENKKTSNMTDNERILALLDGIRMEIFRDFIFKTTRDIERVKRELGEGRKQYVPLYSIVKILSIQCDSFYEKAKLNERCIGRVSLQGVLLFQEGLPMHSKYYFIIGCVMAFVSILPVKEPPSDDGSIIDNNSEDPNVLNGIAASTADEQYYYKVDCLDVIMGLENCKIYFTIGLLMVLYQFHEYGEYMIKSECLWLCSILEINPPQDLLFNHLAKGLKEFLPKEYLATGIFSDDPVDLVNSIISLPTDIESINRRNKNQNEGTQKSSNSKNSKFDNLSIEESNNEYSTNKNQQILETIKDFRLLVPTLKRLQKHLPFKDCIILGAFLGQPDQTIDFTTHKILQVMSLWRRASLAMIKLVMSPPSTEFPRIQEILTTHHNQYTGRKRYQFSNIQCLSPFDNISVASGYLTSIHGLPISNLQSICLLSHSGNCDIWLEDPKQSFRSERLIQELQDMVDLYIYPIPKSMIYSDYLQLSLPKNIIEILKQFDMNYSSAYPLECIRTFLQRDDLALTNNQISIILWSLCGVISNEKQSATKMQKTKVDQSTIATTVSKDDSNTVTEVVTLQQKNIPGFRLLISTVFNDDPEDYMLRFGQDVDHYLHSMPSIDSAVVFGYLSQKLSPTAAYELLSDAMKLDVSARNPMPSTCALWSGMHPMLLADIFQKILLPYPLSNEGNYLLNITASAIAQIPVVSKFEGLATSNTKNLNQPVHVNSFMTKSIFQYISMIHTAIEVDLLIKYSEIIEIKYSDKFYGPVNNSPISSFDLNDDSNSSYWKELLQRRVQRLTRMTLSWRDIMLNEWSESLYISRKLRYQQRVVLIQKSISVYHSQYAGMRDMIVHERSSIMSIYHILQQEIMTLIQDQYGQHSSNTAYYDRMLRRHEGEYERYFSLTYDMAVQYIQHVSSIKRFGIEKVNIASETLQKSLFASCSGLITGYTVGYAQEYFNQLIHRGELWRKTLTTLHGQVILQKEQFMLMKDELDRDLTVQITNRITINRQDTRTHLPILNEHSAVMLDGIATTRNNYAKVQKDTNVRLILRIEKAIREVRKLRNIGELHPELEEEILRDIRTVLTNAKEACLKIVKQIENHSYQQLQSLIPLRQQHREKLETYVRKVSTTWDELEQVLFPFVDEYEQEIKKQLFLVKSKVIDEINRYRDQEIKSIYEEYTQQRAFLILSFRKHFREYDLSELSIFERFNQDVYQSLQDMIRLWGPSKPKFIHQPLKEMAQIANNSLLFSTQDILQSTVVTIRPELTNGNQENHNLQTFTGNFSVQDETILSRVELSDIFTFHLHKSYESLTPVTSQFLKEKQAQLEFIDEMSLKKNGDMIKPQVKAVLDLLISGIEIDHDFYVGHENLIQATNVKANDSLNELSDFVDKYMKPEFPVSIPQTIELTNQKVYIRQQEISALLDASNQHLIADHTKLDVLFQSGEKDIEEWTNLTFQLIENTFHTAELNYLSNLWPSPEATPRLLSQEVDEGIGITGLSEEDRIKKLQALISETQKAPVNLSKGGSTNDALVSALVPVNTPNNLMQYRGDMKELMQNLQLSAEEDRAIQLHKEQKQQEKASKKQQKQQELEQMRKLQDAKEKLLTLPKETKTGLPSLETKELQQGWFECTAPEGYIYYFNPQTNESLWDLPQTLKVPLISDKSSVGGEYSAGSLEVDEFLQTPRELLLVEASHLFPDEKMPIRIVNKDYRLEVKLDPKMIMSEVTEESRAIAALVVNTALDITEIIRGRQGKDESTIATLLGDRYQPALLQQRKSKFHGVEEDDSDIEDQLKLHNYIGEEKAEQFAKDQAEHVEKSSVRDVLLLTKSSPNAGGPDDQQLANMLLDLGLGSALENSLVLDPQEQLMLNSIVHKEQVKQTLSDIIQPQEWLSLGFGATKGDNETENSSDGEDYTGFKSQKSKTTEEIRYSETRENDLMKKEDAFSITVENYFENENCQLFLQKLSSILQDNYAVDEDKEQLRRIGRQIKPSNMKTIFKEFKTSWQKLDELIINTKLREDMKAKELENLRTTEGILRQQYILEHSEDIQDMAMFLHQEANLSKVLSKQMSTELIVRKISTPKKFAKIWSRNEIEVSKEFPELDNDDLEDLHSALKKLLPGSISASQQSISFPVVSTSTVESSPSQQYVAMTPHNSAYAAPPMSATSLKSQNSFVLDPTWVTEVNDDYEEDVEEQSQHSATNHPYTLTKEGYKSFRGGWIEGVSESNEIYYFNVQTGQSSWNLPKLIENENSTSDSNDNHEVVGEQFSGGIPNDNEVNAVPSENYYEDYYYPEYENETGEYHPDSYINYESPVETGTENDYALQQYQPESQWTMSEALGIDHIADFQPDVKPRAIPTYATLEVQAYSKNEGINRQMALLESQDRWQNALVKTQHFITDQQTKFVDKRREMFDKVTKRVESRLNVFVEDIKFMQKVLKKELGEANATERDLRRLFEEDSGQNDSQGILRAEKLSFILESLEKFKLTISEKYDSAFKQIDKFAADWELIKTELYQIGDIYDEGIAANLDQCKLACEHQAKLFVYDQLKLTNHTKKSEMKQLRKSILHELNQDTLEHQDSREKIRILQFDYYRDRQKKKEALYREYHVVDRILEEDLINQGYPPISKDEDVLTEEELTMSFMITQVEMEVSLLNDYNSILDASKAMANELQEKMEEFDSLEKKSVKDDGSLFNKHRETLERHEQALHITLNKVRNRMNEGYQILQSRIEALDYEVERAAEEELYQGSIDQSVVSGGQSTR